MTNWPLELRQLIERMCAARRVLHHAHDHENYEPKLGPPASPEQLVELERKLGAALPPSYRAFLGLHDGWREFEGNFDLLSTADRDDDVVQARLRAISAAFDAVDSVNPLSSWALALGLTMEDEPWRLAVFDRRTARRDGEMEVVTYDDVAEDRRFADFGAFLEHDLSVTRSLLQREREPIR